MNAPGPAAALKAPLVANRRRVRGVVALVVIATAALGLASCAEMPATALGDGTPTPAPGVGQAFGRVVLIEYGKEVKFDFLYRIQLLVQSTRTGKSHPMQITDQNGIFSWTLQPGDYVIVAFNRLNEVGRLWTTFSVSGPGEAAYIGDLHIETSRSGYRFFVRDGFDDTLKDAAAEIRKEGITPVKALMRPEARLGTYARMTSICATQDWGIECDRTNQGVKPLSPDQSAGSHPKTDSLTPRLAWSPAGREGVTYDVAVYESFSTPWVGLSRTRGALVLYAEGLKEPVFQPAAPLSPGKAYEWSVRLRSGDTVSGWSTTGYFAFFIVGVATGSGNWFGFATPDR